MKRKLLSLLVLLMTAVTSAWADHLYLVIDPLDNTKATLKYGDVISGKPFYNIHVGWENNGYSGGFDYFESVTVDASCQDFYGSLHGLFANWYSLETINNIGNLNTFYVSDMGEMFSCCWSLNTLDLRSWDTSNVEDMSSMFNYCWALYTLDLSGWDTSKVKKMNSMFEKCENLKTIYVGDRWSTEKVDNSIDMFDKCSYLPNWDGTTDKTHANTGAGGYLSFKLTAREGATGEYWATYYSTVTNYKSSAQVFKVGLSGTTITMTEITDGIVNSSKGVVLKSNSATITMTPSNAASAGDYTGNSLTGTMTSIDNPGNAYVLNKKAAGVGFYKLSATGTIGANKAYLVSGTGAPEFFGFNENTTGLKAIDNGQLTMDNVVYDLQGRKIANSQKPKAKGLYIVNGKKIIIK